MHGNPSWQALAGRHRARPARLEAGGTPGAQQPGPGQPSATQAHLYGQQALGQQVGADALELLAREGRVEVEPLVQAVHLHGGVLHAGQRRLGLLDLSAQPHDRLVAAGDVVPVAPLELLPGG
jgi:hypothetical protein